jgi:hypothetical protein
MWKPTVLALALASLAGCVIEQPVRVDEPVVRERPVYVPAPPSPAAVVSVVVEPPISQPVPIACPWAPPPMLVEAPPPMPAPDAVWVGGYWIWQGTWVWAHGHWAIPPRPAYHWVEPYYEHREGLVIFIAGHWGAPGVVFVPPPLGVHIELATVRPGIAPGPRPWGPEGVFVPAPPGSRPGIIVPAPVGTPPAVVVSAPPVVNVGMRVQANVNSNNTTIINNVTHVTNITQVTVIAPPSATANGQAVHAIVPAQAHLAAALPPVVKAYAPAPHPVPTSASARPVAAFATETPPASPMPLNRSQPLHVRGEPDDRKPNLHPRDAMETGTLPPPHANEAIPIPPRAWAAELPDDRHAKQRRNEPDASMRAEAAERSPQAPAEGGSHRPPPPSALRSAPSGDSGRHEPAEQPVRRTETTGVRTPAPSASAGRRDEPREAHEREQERDAHGTTGRRQPE